MSVQVYDGPEHIKKLRQVFNVTAASFGNDIVPNAICESVEMIDNDVMEMARNGEISVNSESEGRSLMEEDFLQLRTQAKKKELHDNVFSMFSQGIISNEQYNKKIRQIDENLDMIKGAYREGGDAATGLDSTL